MRFLISMSIALLFVVVVPGCGSRTELYLGALADDGGATNPIQGGGGGDATASSGGGGSGASSGGGSGSGGSGSGSGSGGSSGNGGSASSSGIGGSSSGAGSGSGGRVRDAGPPAPPMAVNDCPNCPGTQICCLTRMGGLVRGTCAATPANCPAGAGAITCAAQMDCNGGENCCVSVNPGGPSTTSCQPGPCAAGSPPACGGMPMDNVDCPGNASAWRCLPIPGTPTAVAGRCVPREAGAPPVVDSGVPVVDSSAVDSAGGADGVGAPDTGSPDAEGGTPPQDAADDGG
jgi:hypothetical protein